MMIGLAVAALLFSPTPDLQDPGTTVLDDIVVDGRRLSERVEDFAQTVVAPPPGRRVARWSDRNEICVGVVNLRHDAAQVIIDRVSSIAMEMNLRIGEPGCNPNVMVIATEDGQAMARSIADTYPRRLRPKYAGAARGRSALEDFINTEAPVRWWHVSVPVTETGDIAVALPFEIPMVAEDGSRITTRLRNELRRAYVIVDVTKTEGLSFQQLGDYAGMVAMAQIDPDADLSGYDTVLNLFRTGRSVSGLTGWDQSYLTALYSAEMNRRVPSQQNGQISRIMYHDQQRQADAAE